MLSTFQGIHERVPLLGDESSTASRILRELERLTAAAAEGRGVGNYVSKREESLAAKR